MPRIMLCCILSLLANRQADGALMKSESVNEDGGIGVTLAANYKHKDVSV